MTTGYEAITSALSEFGVRTLHGVMGDGNFHLIQSWVHDVGGRYVAARHEAGAVGLADGHARVGAPHTLGVATVTHGPGLTNTVTALTAAVRNRTPLLLIAGDLPRAAFRHNQRVDQAAVVATTGAGYVSATTSTGAHQQVFQAIRKAVLERRPVVLDIANDVQREQWEQPVDVGRLRSLVEEVRRQRPEPDPGAVTRAAELLAAARRPVILAGRGAVWSGARADLVALADRCGALLATTLLAKDWFADEPWSLGVVGTFGSALSAEVLADADCVVAFGASLHTWSTSVGRLYPRAKVIQVDLHESELGDFTPVDAVVLGDAARSAQALLTELGAGYTPTTFYRTPELRDRLSSWSPRLEIADPAPDGQGRVDPRLALAALNDLLPIERLVFSDAGHFWSYPGYYLDVPDPHSFVLAANFGSLGLGLATAIGGALARPDRLPVLVAGDGGLLMSITEFETAVRYGVPLVLVVLNDAAYGSEVHAMRAAGLSPETARFPDTDFARLAQGYGAEGMTVRALSDLAEVARRLPGLSGPLVVDIKIDPDLVAPWFRVAKLGGSAAGKR